jgi:hypothetical protein
MTTGDPITRRDALCELASIPMITLGDTHTLYARHYEEMLRYCTVALEGCWELYRGGDPDGSVPPSSVSAYAISKVSLVSKTSFKLRSNPVLSAQ